MVKSSLIIFLTLVIGTQLCFSKVDPNATTALNRIAKPKVIFTENKGQWDNRVLFKTESKGGLTWFLERDGVTLLCSVPDTTKPPLQMGGADNLVCDLRHEPKRYPMKSHALKFRFVNVGAQFIAPASQTGLSAPPGRGGSPCPPDQTPVILPQGELPWYNNYFLGNDESKWAPECRNFERVIYKNVWSGIDIEWYEKNGNLEFDFIVQPGANPAQIAMQCDGLEGDLSLNDSRGGLVSPPIGVLLAAPLFVG